MDIKVKKILAREVLMLTVVVLMCLLVGVILIFRFSEQKGSR